MPDTRSMGPTNPLQCNDIINESANSKPKLSRIRKIAYSLGGHSCFLEDIKPVLALGPLVEDRASIVTKRKYTLKLSVVIVVIGG
jgi:hypothetical protein